MSFEDIQKEIFSDNQQLDFNDYQEDRDRPNATAVNIHHDRQEVS
tara:strand:- start:366 stop:500 length:135 start_codon:yes stop_codon:yes gene_type:complete